MDVSPIARVMPHPTGPPAPVAPQEETTPVAPAAQGSAAEADHDMTRHRPDPAPTRVLVSWHASSLGYVTSVVDQHSGSVLYQSPPEQVLAMVQAVIERLEGRTA